MKHKALWREMGRACAVVMMGILAATTVEVGAVGMYISCEGDHECGRDKYCYTSGYCVSCTDCLIYKRENRTSYPYCAKSAVECGRCLPGFEEEIFTTGEVRYSCIPISSQSEDSSRTLYFTVGAIMTICVLLLGVFIFYKSYRKQGNTYYYSDGYLTIIYLLFAVNCIIFMFTVDAGISDIRETSFIICKEKEHEPLQQARPFQYSGARYHSDEEQEEPPNTPPYLHDDETLESNWTPPDYEEAVPPSNTNEPNNQTDENALPSSSQPASTANTSVDSGLSNSSSAVSSVSLPQRPFQGLGLSSNAVVSVEQPLTVHTRSHSDDDVSTSARSPKRARRDSGAQSLDDNPAPINVVGKPLHLIARSAKLPLQKVNESEYGTPAID
ncbi:hypothetical protein Cfor_04555 [Coptotermes formosanus]|uniref:Uncharacterized protein n=1 Tax=Coptotermes formosanus TaxID=36987 RepID=A0A6L2PTU0_COPFO|nr:hypothetical protein Cfor_04555 [Coptotermes formosanus]